MLFCLFLQQLPSRPIAMSAEDSDASELVSDDSEDLSSADPDSDDYVDMAIEERGDSDCEDMCEDRATTLSEGAKEARRLQGQAKARNVRSFLMSAAKFLDWGESRTVIACRVVLS